MTVGEALIQKLHESGRGDLPAGMIQDAWPELFWAELIPDFDEAPEERLRIALIRPLTKKEDS